MLYPEKIYILENLRLAQQMRLITFTIVNLVIRYPQQRRRPYLTYLHAVYLTATVYPQIITLTFRGKI